MTRSTITRRALLASLAALPFLGRRTEAQVPATTGEFVPLDYCAEGVEYAPFQAIGGRTATDTVRTVSSETAGYVSLSEGWYAYRPVDWYRSHVCVGGTADWPEGGAG